MILGWWEPLLPSVQAQYPCWIVCAKLPPARGRNKTQIDCTEEHKVVIGVNLLLSRQEPPQPNSCSVPRIVGATKDTLLFFQFLQDQKAQEEPTLDDTKQCMKTAEVAVREQAGE